MVKSRAHQVRWGRLRRAGAAPDEAPGPSGWRRAPRAPRAPAAQPPGSGAGKLGERDGKRWKSGRRMGNFTLW